MVKQKAQGIWNNLWEEYKAEWKTLWVQYKNLIIPFVEGTAKYVWQLVYGLIALSLKILHEEADIVCTNPPFSRARDYWRVVINSGKKFLIISNITNPANTAFIPYFMSGQVWAGFNSVDWYLNPKREPVRAAGHWFTNIPIANRPKAKNLKFVPLDEIPERFKKYDDAGNLIVDNNFIPAGYEAPLAVSPRAILNGILEKGYKIVQDKKYVPYFNGREAFARILVQKV